MAPSQFLVQLAEDLEGKGSNEHTRCVALLCRDYAMIAMNTEALATGRITARDSDASSTAATAA